MTQKRKILFIGDLLTGKTTLILRLISNTFNEDPKAKLDKSFLTYTSNNIEYQLWDSNGDFQYRSLIPAMFEKTYGVIVTFALDSKESFESVDGWIQMAKSVGPRTERIVLVGTKSDGNCVVSEDEIAELCKDHQVNYISCSSKTGENVDKILDKFDEAQEVSQMKQTNEQKGVNVLKQRKQFEKMRENEKKKLSEEEMKKMNYQMHTKNDKEYKYIEIILYLILGVFVVAFGYVFWFSRKVQADIDAGKV